MKRFWQKEKGFTLIELLIVVAIIGIVAGIAIPRFLGARTVAKVTRAFADMRSLADGLEMYFTAENQYPLTLAGLTTAEPTYITSIPKDPFGTDDVPNIRYYCNGDEDTPATMWLIVSNGPDLSADVTIAADADWEALITVAGELGGPNGVNPTGDDTYYGVGAGDGGWSLAKSATNKGDIGRGGP